MRIIGVPQTSHGRVTRNRGSRVVVVGDDGMSSPEAMRAISEIGVRRGERDGGQWDTELQMPQSKGASSNRIWAAWSLAFDRARTVRSQRTKRSLARLQAPQISSATTAFSTSSTSTRQTQVLVEGALGVHKALVCLTRLPKLLLYFSSEGGVKAPTRCRCRRSSATWRAAAERVCRVVPA